MGLLGSSSPPLSGLPHGACPAHWMLLAACSPRSAMESHLGQLWVRMEREFDTRAPHAVPSARVLEHSGVVNAGGMASTRVPAHAALHARILRKVYPPTALSALLRPRLRA